MENKLDNEKIFDVLIIGGLGHVGLPLGLVFAKKDLKVCLLDVDKNRAEIVGRGIMPFIEYGAEPILKEVLEKGNLKISLDKRDIAKSKNIIITIGTDIDKHLNPKTKQFVEFISEIKEYLDSSQNIIIRSTIYPTTCRKIYNILGRDKNLWNLTYCPERIVQGHGIKELSELPQIVSGFNEKAVKNVSELFSKISPKIIEVSVEEAELIKLFSNALRYIQFATANQFYIIANKLGVDYDKIRAAMKIGYERVHSLPSAGFSAGPCLFKDTMHLVSFDDTNFSLGHSAMMVNEGMPNFIIENLKKKYDLSKIKVGILGMAFKAEIDDIRDSLSYKLLKLLKFHGAKVSCSDEFVKNPNFVSKEELIKNSDVIIIGAPHSIYKELSIPGNVEVVDLWGITKK